MKNKKMFLMKANILGFIMIASGFIFIACFGSMIEDFNWFQPFILIISGFTAKEIYCSKAMKMWMRIPIKDTKMS